MKNPQSILNINLQPKPGKPAWNCNRSWQEEIIYFLMVDRFHDSRPRNPIATSGKGFGSIDELQRIYGGTLTGIRKNLTYIQNLGCTALWLSPVFENNPQSYHGYAIQNFLKVDSRFGTKQDLEELIEEAHKHGMKVFLDAVINHSGDNWQYREKADDCIYNKGEQYNLGPWNSNEYPVPVELRNKEYYKRKGRIANWDLYPETTEGDFFSLKKFNHDESEIGLALQETLLKAYCYWIREVDCDGFRMDAVKHLGALPTARFSSKVKEYARLLGKENFFIFGEITADDNFTSQFIEPAYSEYEKKIYKGLDTFLDFPLHFCLPKMVNGSIPFTNLVKRYESVQEKFGTQSRNGIRLVNFLDNHDQIEKPYKKRIAAELNEKQLLGALGILLCLPGVPCIYYGTEQAYKGEGEGDAYIREAMFDQHNTIDNALNEEGFIFKEFKKIAGIKKDTPELSSGSLIFPLLSLDGVLFEKGDIGVCVFLRRLFGADVLVAYNVSTNESKAIYVQLDKLSAQYRVLYGKERSLSSCHKRSFGKPPFFLRLELEPMEFIILK